MVFRDKKTPLPAIDGLERTRGSRGRTTYYLADGLMRINASVCKERIIGAEESPVIRLTPDFRDDPFNHQETEADDLHGV